MINAGYIQLFKKQVCWGKNKINQIWNRQVTEISTEGGTVIK